MAGYPLEGFNSDFPEGKKNDEREREGSTKRAQASQDGPQGHDFHFASPQGKKNKERKPEDIKNKQSVCQYEMKISGDCSAPCMDSHARIFK